MKKVLFMRILNALFIVATMISIFIIYKKIDNNGSFVFLVGYVFFTFFMLISVFFITLINARKSKWVHVRKSILRFIILLIVFSISNYVFDFIIRPEKIDLLRNFSTSLGLSFGIAFFDITYSKEFKR